MKKRLLVACCIMMVVLNVVACGNVKTSSSQSDKYALILEVVDDNDNKLSGVSFEIKDANNNVVQTVTTSSEGNVAYSLPSGKYSATVVSAPANVILDSEPFGVEITDQGTLVRKVLQKKV